jgi:anti-sigma B factor antagonist
MRSASRPVFVKRVPSRFDREHAIRFYSEARLVLNSDRPQIVFDMSNTGYMDSGGLDVLLRCLREAMKCDGDVKLAGLIPPVSIVLEMTRIGPFFEVYENTTAAAKSFTSFLPNVGSYPHHGNRAANIIASPPDVADEDGDETSIAA